MSNGERTAIGSSGTIELADNFVVIQPNKPKSPMRWILPLCIIAIIVIGLWYSYQLSRPLIRVIIDSKQIISEKALLDMPSFIDSDTLAFSRDGDSGGAVLSFKQLNPSDRQFFTKSYSKVEYSHPMMSPDASEGLLMFTIKQYNTPRIYALPLNGTPRELAYGEWASSYKDGKKIVFQRVSQRYNNEKPEIWVMNTDGSDQKSTNLKGRHPECSTKRDQLVFEGNNSGISSIQITKIENPEQNLKILTKKDNCLYPSFSPDGKLILFYKKGDGLWVTRNNGSRQQRIIKASKSSEIMIGRISPDGKRLAVWSGTKNEGKLSIYKIKYRNIRPSKQKVDVSSLVELIDSIKLSDKNDLSVTENQAKARPDVNISEPENNKSFAYVSVKKLTPKEGIIIYIDNNKKVATTPINNPITVEPGLHKIKLENPKSGATWEENHNFQIDETYKLPDIDLR